MKTIKFHGNKNIIAEKVAAERNRLGISQQELAARLQTLGVNIDQQAVSKIERNLRIVTDYEVLCFAKALNVDEKWLLGDYKDFKKTQLKKV